VVADLAPDRGTGDADASAFRSGQPGLGQRDGGSPRGKLPAVLDNGLTRPVAAAIWTGRRALGSGRPCPSRRAGAAVETLRPARFRQRDDGATEVRPDTPKRAAGASLITQPTAAASPGIGPGVR